MRTVTRLLLAPALALILIAGVLLAPQTATNVRSAPIGNNILARAVDIELGRAQRRSHEQLLSSGTLYSALEATGELAKRADAATTSAQQRVAANNDHQGGSGPSELSKAKTQGCQNVFSGGGTKNTRVNQDCSLRRQAEEVIAINPNDPNNLIAGQNDSRVGFNHCGYDWSFDGGKTWGDQVPPFYQFVLADGHTADACSDPTVTFDADGNAYIAGVLFDINSAASAFVVAKSNADVGGAFFHSPVSGAFQEYSTAPLGVVANDNDPNIAHDKEFIVADANRHSHKKNNVYATWTRFAAGTGAGVGANSPIYFSQSTDGGAHWSPGIEISGANAAFCTNFSGSANANACDQDQGSHPVVGADGTVYVAFGNGNTAVLGLNQHMIVSCPRTKDCSQQASWTAPAKISDDYGTQPFGPDPATACAGGRQCLPPNGYRLDDFVEGSVSVDDSGKLYFVWADFRNGNGSSCDWNNAATGQAALVTPPCDNDVFYSFSTNGGVTWSAAAKLTPAGSAQWQPWSDVSADGRALWVAYYDRSYGNCEFSGCNDITLVKVANPASGRSFTNYKRITTSSMPNLIPANNPVQAGFLGDYMWVTVDRFGKPYVVWADTRGLNSTVEEDIYLYIGEMNF